jgi:hypothetical protein
LIKGGLDKVTGFVEVLDSDFGQTAVKITAVTAALAGLSKVIGAIASSKFVGVLKQIPTLISAISGALAGSEAAASALTFMLGPLTAMLPVLLSIAGVIAGIKLYDHFHVDYDEQIDKVKSLKDEYEELYGVEGEYEALKAKQSSGGGLSAYEQSRLDYLEQYKKSLEETMELEKQAALEH